MFKDNYSQKSQSAFALIELLVAMAIFAIVSTVVYTTLYTGIKAYQRTQIELTLNKEVNRVLDRLSVELRNCYDAEYVEEEDEGGFIADAQSLSFFTIQNDYSQGDFRKSLARFSYSFRDGKLFKKSQVDKNAFLSAENFPEQELLSDIHSLDFQYLYFKKTYNEREYSYEWKSEWLDRSLVPYGIKVEIVKLDLKENIQVSLKRCILMLQGEIDAQMP